MKAIVLAAGKGKRLASEAEGTPKVMRLANGAPLLSYVLRALDFIPEQDTVIVVGYMADTVRGHFGPEYRFALQDRQLGTGHAVSCAMPALEDYDGPVLVCYGDMPLVRKQTYEAMIRSHQESGGACTLLAGYSPLIDGFGRVICDDDGGFVEVVEQRDCTPEQLQIKRYNAGIYVFDAAVLRSALPKLQNNNSQNEYYLTDVPALLKKEGRKISVFSDCGGDEILGVNTLEDLRYVERRIAEFGL